MRRTRRRKRRRRRWRGEGSRSYQGLGLTRSRHQSNVRTYLASGLPINRYFLPTVATLPPSPRLRAPQPSERRVRDAPPRGFSPPGDAPHVVEPLRFDRDGGERELGGCCDERSPRHAAQPASLWISPPDCPIAVAPPRTVQPISPLPVAFPRPARGGDSTRGLLGCRARPGTTNHRGEGPPARCQAAHPPVL